MSAAAELRALWARRDEPPAGCPTSDVAAEARRAAHPRPPRAPRRPPGGRGRHALRAARTGHPDATHASWQGMLHRDPDVRLVAAVVARAGAASDAHLLIAAHAAAALRLGERTLAPHEARLLAEARERGRRALERLIGPGFA